MVRKSGLTNGIAKALEVSPALVSTYYRALSEAGMLSANGARGVNGSALLPIDAARILIAILVTDRAGEAAEAVTDFGRLTISGEGTKTENKWSIAAVMPTSRHLEDVVAELLGDLAEYKGAAADLLGFRLTIEADRIQARIEAPGLALDFADGQTLWSHKHVRWYRKVRVSRAVKGDVLAEIAALFRNEVGASEPEIQAAE